MRKALVVLLFLSIGLLFPRVTLALTFSDLATKLNQVLNKQQQVYPLYQLAGYDVDKDGTVDTLSSLDAKYAAVSPEERADWRARLLCDQKPNNSSNLETWAAWRQCVGGGHVILIRHHLREYLDHGRKVDDQTRLATHFYLAAVHLDALTTGSEAENIFRIAVAADPPQTYKLRDTGKVMRYLPDAAGFYEAFGWGYSYGVLPRYYCTSLETPHDSGRSCKTINLWERIRKIHSAIATKVAGEWMIHSDGTLRTEYWNNSGFWQAVKSGQPFLVAPNTTFNPGANIGWYDLAGRRSMGTNTNATSMSPHFFHWQMSGMADAAKIVLNEGGIYQTAYDFGLQVAAHTVSLDPNNTNGDNAALNYYGQPVRGLSNYCDVPANFTAENPLDVCQSGKHEWFEYGETGAGMVPNQTGLAYTAQHLDVLMETLNWGNLPSIYRENALYYYYAYKANFYKDADSYIDFTNGGYNQATINKYFPGLIGTCGQPNFRYYQEPSGRIVSNWGETAAELLATLAPSFVHIISQKDSARADELLQDTNNALTDLLINPLRPEGSACSGGNWIGFNTYARSAWQYNNLLLSYFLFKKARVETIPQICDLDANFQINTQDLKESLLTYGNPTPECTEDGKNNSLDFIKIMIQIGQPTPSPLDLPLPSATPALLPDGIKWEPWTQINLASTGLPPEALPLESRVVFKTPNGQWFDSVTKDNLCWNRVTNDYNNWGSWIGNCNLNTAGYPSESIPFGTRVVYQQPDSQMIEGLTKGSQAWMRYIPTWFNPQPWLPVIDLIPVVPAEVLPAQAREVVILSNQLQEDLWIKGETLWFRTFYPANWRTFVWTPVSLKAYGFPEAAQSGIDTLAIWKDPAGKWVQSISKGNDAWTRWSQ